MKIISIRYKSTSYYLVDTGSGLLAFDAGWPDTYAEYRDKLKQELHSAKDIKWFMVSHFHIDHAGLAGMFVQRGIELAVFKNQIYGISEMEALIERKNIPCPKIDQSRITVLETSDSRDWLLSRGIQGEVIVTNGHCEQSISLLLDSGEAFTGDLAPLSMIGRSDPKSKDNWETLARMGAKRILPAHGIPYFL